MAARKRRSGPARKRKKPGCFEQAPRGAERVADTRERLVAKLDPRRFRGMSGKMAAIVRYVLAAPPVTEPWVAGLSVTSDGFVILRPASDEGLLHDEFLGTASDLDGNIARLLRVADLLPDELELFLELYAERVARYDEGGIEAEIAELLGAGPPPTTGDAKLRKTIAKLRNMTTERGCSPDEAASAQEEADRLERKLDAPRGRGRWR